MERFVVCGDVAHLGERSVRIAEVRGSSPLVSTTHTTVPPLPGGGFSLGRLPMPGIEAGEAQRAEPTAGVAQREAPADTQPEP